MYSNILKTSAKLDDMFYYSLLFVYLRVVIEIRWAVRKQKKTKIYARSNAQSLKLNYSSFMYYAYHYVL